MRKFFTYIVFLFLSIGFTQAQYNNEWIVPGKNYYKFKIGTTGLYRLDNNFLNAIGIGGVDKSSLQLWRNGVQVAMYTTNDYVEFWGEQNDGSTDAALFQSPDQQLDKRKSLHADSATLFLTVNENASGNLRFVNADNNVAGKPAGIGTEPYFMYKKYLNDGSTFNYGLYSPYISEPIYDSRYFYKSFGWQVTPSGAYTLNFNNLYLNPAVTARLTLGVSGLSYVGGNRLVKAATSSGTQIISENLEDLSSKFMTGTINLSGDASVVVSEVPGTGNANSASDRIMLNYGELEYARNFNFGGESQFAFKLNGNGGAKYLEITNFNAGGSAPVLYDITQRKRYTAVVSGNTYQFYLPSVAAENNYVLTSQAASGYKVVSAGNVLTRQYKNLADAGNQGNYLIISNKALYGEGNYVQQYADYRNSATGGAHKAKIYDIDDLEDMFAFGIKGHPLSIKNFIRYAGASFSIKPNFVLLIGRGLPFYQNKQQAGNAAYQAINFVPTYGYPGSDIMLAANGLDPVPTVNIGRISAVQPAEIKIYLDKIKQYEAQQKFTNYSIADNAWKKNVIFATGASNIYEGSLFDTYMTTYRNTLTDTLFGAKDYNYSKTNTGSVSGNLSNDMLKNLFAKGVGLISYYGHGASTTLGYQELSSPLPYDYNGKYPIFITSGCDVGDYFSYISGRVTNLNNIPESYIFTKDKGSIAFMAQSHLGVTSYLHRYNETFYQQLVTTRYCRPMFESMIAANKDMVDEARQPDVDSICYISHAEQTNLLGDPAVLLNYAPKPDFAIEENQVITPANVSYTTEKFTIKFYLYNIGKATGDSVEVDVIRKLPDGSTETMLSQKIRSVRNVDSIEVEAPANMEEKYIGNNDFIITVDKNARYDELSEANNTVTKRVVIYSDGLLPVYPYNYAIIDNATAKLVASTSDPLAASKQYVMELDTTALFNSAAKITKAVTSKGGVLEFDPGISYVNERVYYWRVGAAPQNGDDYKWSNSSFQYIAGKGEGFGQAHFYQHLNSTENRIVLDSATRRWQYGNIQASYVIAHQANGNGEGTGTSSYNVEFNGLGLASAYCRNLGNSLSFNLIAENGKPIINQNNPSTTPDGTLKPGTGNGFMGSTSACSATPYSYDVNPASLRNRSTYQFSINNKSDRDKIAAFMTWIPKGTIVLIRLNIEPPLENVPLINTWKADGGSSLYNAFIENGLYNIETFTAPKAGVFIFKKGDKSFAPIQELTIDAYGKIQSTGSIPVNDTTGYIFSPKFGAAKAWKSIEWNGSSLETSSSDIANIQLMGYTATGDSTSLLTLNKDQNSYDLSGISAAQYPYLQLRMENKDAANSTPYQLQYWRILSTQLPEGAIAPNISFAAPDTIRQGQDIKLTVSFKNVSNQAFTDSLVNRVTLTNSNNVTYLIPVAKLKNLSPGETQVVEFTIPGDSAAYNAKVTDPQLKMPVSTKDLNGKLTIGIDVNPGLQTAEFMHNNNFLYKTVYSVKEEAMTNMDVTVDGIHIMDNDIISAKPKFAIRVADASKYILIKDTSSVKVALQYPSGQIRYFNYNSDTLQFYAAQSPDKNEALVDFKPYLTEDGTYQLTITGRNASNPNAAPANYTVSFQVYNKPMISDMFNYPNPFTTSTAFVFTITGSQVPQNLRIQIMTITGKIVKEITRQELGNLNVGRNITEYKWDGTDHYGQQLANGVYLYRVITNQDGKKLDNFSIKDASGNTVNTSQYFNKGYGKMYLMR